MKTFVCYMDWKLYIEDMTVEEKANFLDCLFDYQNGDEAKPMDTIRLLWKKVVKQFEENKAKREAELIKKSEAGKLGMAKRRGNITPDNTVITQITPVISVTKNITPITDTVTVTDTVNNILSISYIKGVEDFVLFQKENMPTVAYQIEKQGIDIYLQKQYDAYNKVLSLKKIDSSSLDMILGFIKEDKFWNKNIGSVTKLLEKNKEGIPYWVVMIDKIKGSIDNNKVSVIK